jgi:N-acyl-L-homoserine lactone synthetase
MFIAGEDMEIWADQMMEALVNVARHNGCLSIEGMGRPGWTRFLKRYGFNFLCTTVERKV